MLTFNVFQRLHRHGASRHYRKMLRETIQQERAVRWLPNLLSLSLPHGTADHSGTAALLAHSPYVGLCGDIGSGRSLMLQQLVWQQTAHSSDDPVLYLGLSSVDDDNLPPRSLLEHALRVTGLPSPLEGSDTANVETRWLLLIDDWEELPPLRRAEWQAFFRSLPGLLPAARVVIALPASEPADAWHGFRMVHMATPDATHLQAWVAHLLPQHDTRPLLEALPGAGSLSARPPRLLDVALLALTYPQHGVPASRAQLYAHAYAMLEADQTNMSQRAIIGGSALSCYTQARALEATPDWSMLTDLNAERRAEVLLMLAAMLPDPAPLYEQLWASKADPAELLLAGSCLLEQPTTAPEWSLRIVGALLQHSDSARFQQVLDHLAPFVPGLLFSRTRQTGSVPAEAGHVLQHLAPQTGAAALLDLAWNIDADPVLRWQAGEALLQLPTDTIVASVADAAPPDPLAQAIRSYVLALGDTHSRRLLADSGDYAWIAAMQDKRVGLERRKRVLAALLADEQIPADLRSAVMALLPRAGEDDVQQTHNVLVDACADQEATVRQVALHALLQHEPQQAVTVLHDILLTPAHTVDIYHDAIEQLAHHLSTESSLLLAHTALAEHLPLAVRLRALLLLANRRKAGGPLLRRIATITTAHPLVLATAARLLVQHGYGAALPELCALAASDVDLLVRQAAIEVVGQLGHQTGSVAPVLHTLHAILKREIRTLPLTLSVIQALGYLGHPAGLSALDTLSTLDMQGFVRQTWLAEVPELEHLPVSEWNIHSMPPALRRTLASLLTSGDTDADTPGNLEELVRQQADQLQQAIESAMAQIARHARPETRHGTQSRLLAAVQQPGTEQQIIHRLDCLINASPDAGEQDLARLLTRPDLNPVLRWLVIERLSARPAAAPLLLRSLEQSVLDPFSQGKLISALGQQRMQTALPVLRQFAEQRSSDIYLRMQAIQALSKLNDSAVETTLLHIVADVTATPALRAAAAEALPATIGTEIRHWLYELLRRERQPAELIAGILRTLGRTHDPEMLGLGLKYPQNEHPEVSIAALDALAELNDTSIVANLVRLTQNNLVDQHIRLHTVVVLLRLSGSEHLPLLRYYLDSNVLSFQLRALDALLELRPNDPRPLLLLADKTAPLALRLRSVEALQSRPGDHGVLHNLLLNNSDTLNLQLAAANVLATTASPDAIAALETSACRVSTPPRLRRRCIDALSQCATSEEHGTGPAWLALSRIADDPAQSGETRTWASSALVCLINQ